MLSKCANPDCTNSFRYLHEGKLYLVDSGSTKRKQNGSFQSAGKSSVPEYAWLCSSCCGQMSIRIDEVDSVLVICEVNRGDNDINEPNLLLYRRR